MSKKQKLPKLLTYWDSHPDQSAAFQRFKRCHTDLNDRYWGTILTRIIAFKHSSALDVTKTLVANEILTEKQSKRFPKMPREWQTSVKSNESWIRSSALVSASAYLEKFIHEMATISIMADPGVTFRRSKSISGLFFLKMNVLPPGLDVVHEFTKGDWTKRLSSLRKTFPLLPEFNGDLISVLENGRKHRNLVAHRFGFGFNDLPSYRRIEIEEKDEISEAFLLKYFDAAGKLASILDKSLTKHHVGEFETLYFWHKWDRIVADKRLAHDWQKLKFGAGSIFMLYLISKDKAKNLIEIYNNNY